MERILLLLRHGKSRHNMEYAADFERPLAPRGIRDAPRMAAQMKRKNIVPQLIISSPAARALTTAELVHEALDGSELLHDDELYAADIDDFYNALERVGDDVQTVLLVSHNPGLELLVDDLIGTYDNVMKTCSLAVIRCDCNSWRDLARSKCELSAIYHPRELE